MTSYAYNHIIQQYNFEVSNNFVRTPSSTFSPALSADELGITSTITTPL